MQGAEGQPKLTFYVKVNWLRTALIRVIMCYERNEKYDWYEY